MNRVSMTMVGLALAATFTGGQVSAQQAPAPSPVLSPVLAQLKAICQSDIQKLCPNVQPGGGRIIACMAEHQDQITPPCKKAISQAQQSQGQNATTPPPSGQSQTLGQ